MLRSRSDLQSLAYLLGYPALILWQWRHGSSLALYSALLIVSVGISIIHHNHTHLPIWRRPGLNRFTSFWIALLHGCPSFVFHPAHIENHHRYNHGPLDEARTYRFGGDHNHGLGYLLHPFQALLALRGLILGAFREARVRQPALYRDACLQGALLALMWIALLIADPWKFLWLILIPQLHGIHWLLGANYLQHAHADGNSTDHFARNFTGLMNRVWFNIGFHTAHHRHPRAHWSRLRELHRMEQDLLPALVEKSLVLYVLRTYLLAPFIPQFRSRSLMNGGSTWPSPATPKVGRHDPASVLPSSGP